MIEKATRFLRTLRGYGRINMALTRGQVGSAQRKIDPTDPSSWEFSGFSQNGEDGIIDVLLGALAAPTRFFVEIGSADGLENNTSWLSIVHRYSGLWVEANEVNVARARELFGPLNHGVLIRQLFITAQNARDMRRELARSEPDLLSIDIDSYDFFVAQSLLDSGLRPSIACVEYNSAFGPDDCVSVGEGSVSNPKRTLADRLHYGCSIGAWRTLFGQFGYRFLTVEQNGVNAFFVDPSRFTPGFMDAVRGVPFAENYAQKRDVPNGWEAQRQMIADRAIVRVD